MNMSEHLDPYFKYSQKIILSTFYKKVNYYMLSNLINKHLKNTMLPISPKYKLPEGIFQIVSYNFYGGNAIISRNFLSSRMPYSSSSYAHQNKEIQCILIQFSDRRKIIIRYNKCCLPSICLFSSNKPKFPGLYMKISSGISSKIDVVSLIGDTEGHINNIPSPARFMVRFKSSMTIFVFSLLSIELKQFLLRKNKDSYTSQRNILNSLWNDDITRKQ